MQTVQIPNSCGNIRSLVLAGRFKGIAVGIPPISRSPLLLHSVVLAVPDLPKAPLVILTTWAFCFSGLDGNVPPAPPGNVLQLSREQDAQA